MKRRTLIGAGGLLLAGRAAFAQPVRKVYRVGVLTSFTASDYAGPQPSNANAKALLRGMAELGYVYGQHYVTKVRSAEGNMGRMPTVAADLAALGTDVIVCAGPALVSAGLGAPYIVSANSSRPISMRRISLVPAPIS